MKKRREKNTGQINIEKVLERQRMRRKSKERKRKKAEMIALKMLIWERLNKSDVGFDLFLCLFSFVYESTESSVNQCKRTVN